MSHYQKHIFFCTNIKDRNRKCCSQGDASNMSEYLKSKLKSLDLWGEGKMRVSTSGCLGFCRKGPAMVIYPEDLWYTYSCEADIDEIFQNSILHNRIVKRLLIKK